MLLPLVCPLLVLLLLYCSCCCCCAVAAAASAVLALVIRSNGGGGRTRRSRSPTSSVLFLVLVWVCSFFCPLLAGFPVRVPSLSVTPGSRSCAPALPLARLWFAGMLSGTSLLEYSTCYKNIISNLNLYVVLTCLYLGLELKTPAKQISS